MKQGQVRRKDQGLSHGDLKTKRTGRRGEPGKVANETHNRKKMGERVDSYWTSLGSLNKALQPMKIIASIFELITQRRSQIVLTCMKILPQNLNGGSVIYNPIQGKTEYWEATVRRIYHLSTHPLGEMNHFFSCTLGTFPSDSFTRLALCLLIYSLIVSSLKRNSYSSLKPRAQSQ